MCAISNVCGGSPSHGWGHGWATLPRRFGTYRATSGGTMSQFALLYGPCSGRRARVHPARSPCASAIIRTRNRRGGHGPGNWNRRGHFGGAGGPHSRHHNQQSQIGGQLYSPQLFQHFSWPPVCCSSLFQTLVLASHYSSSERRANDQGRPERGDKHRSTMKVAARVGRSHRRGRTRAACRIGSASGPRSRRTFTAMRRADQLTTFGIGFTSLPTRRRSVPMAMRRAVSTISWAAQSTPSHSVFTHNRRCHALSTTV